MRSFYIDIRWLSGIDNFVIWFQKVAPATDKARLPTEERRGTGVRLKVEAVAESTRVMQDDYGAHKAVQ